MLILILSHSRYPTSVVLLLLLLLLLKNIYYAIGRLDDILNTILPRISVELYICIFVGSLRRIGNAYDTFQRNKKTFIDIIYLTNVCGSWFYNTTKNISKF